MYKRQGRRKALASVLEAAKVVDTEGNVVDLDEIDPGSDEDEDDVLEGVEDVEDLGADEGAETEVETDTDTDTEEQADKA